jgi:hypothetical protein
MPQKQRLSLQVPPNVGNPVVRLVTPTVLVNGEENSSPGTNLGPSPISAASTQVSPAHHQYEQQSMYQKQPDRPTHQTYHGAITPSETPAQTRPPPPTRSQTSPADISTATSPLPAIAPETINRALAAELIRAPLTNRRKRLRGNEAKILATAILQPLYSKPASGHSSSTSPANSKVMSDSALGVAIASCLGLTSAVGVGIGGPTGGVRRVECIRFRVGGDGYESPVDDEDEEGESPRDGTRIKETFDVFFGVNFGGLVGEWVVKGLEISSSGEEIGEAVGESSRASDELERNETPAAWKTKFLDAQRRLWEKEEEVKSLKDKILEAVL